MIQEELYRTPEPQPGLSREIDAAPNGSQADAPASDKFTDVRADAEKWQAHLQRARSWAKKDRARKKKEGLRRVEVWLPGKIAARARKMGLRAAAVVFAKANETISPCLVYISQTNEIEPLEYVDSRKNAHIPDDKSVDTPAETETLRGSD